MPGKGRSPAPASIWEELDRFTLSTPTRRPDPAGNPFGPRREDPTAFRPMTVQDHLALARAPKRRDSAAPYIVDPPPATYDYRDGGGRQNVLDLRNYKSGDTLRLPGADVRITPVGRPAVELQPGYGRGREAAREGPVLIPPGPDGASVDANMDEARRHSPLWLGTKVPNGKPWDYKQQARRYEAFGNFNFGAAGRSARLPEGVLLKGAGWAQGRAHEGGPDFGNPYLGTGSYGDDPIDQFWIAEGSRYHEAKRR